MWITFNIFQNDRLFIFFFSEIHLRIINLENSNFDNNYLKETKNARQ